MDTTSPKIDLRLSQDRKNDIQKKTVSDIRRRESESRKEEESKKTK